MDNHALTREFIRHQPGRLRLLTSRWRTLPQFLVIGAQRCGTSSLYRYLQAHPQIRWARVKEVHYFDRSHSFGTAWYRAQFPLRLPWSQDWLAGDASPYYLFHPHAPERAAALVPQAKLIVILRNPTDRAYSQYQHVVSRGHEQLSFEAALEREEREVPAEERRILEQPDYRSLVHERHAYVARGRYVDQLERWLGRYPRDQLLVLRSDELFRSPHATLARAFTFLGLRSMKVDEVPNRKPGQYPEEMPLHIRARLVEHFRPYNRRLEELLGMPLDWDR